MQAVDTVIHELQHWTVANENSSPIKTHGNSSTNDSQKARPTPCKSKIFRALPRTACARLALHSAHTIER